MKNNITKHITSVILLCMILINLSYAQSDKSGVGTGHQGAGNTGYYVGWDANTTFDLNIKHMATGASAKSINFFTKATQRMTIRGNNGSTDGFVGIGNGFTSPVSRLHIHQSGDDLWFQMSNNTTAKTVTDGLRIGIEAATSNVQFKQFEKADMLFWTNATTTGSSISERMRIKSDGKVGVGTSSPTARLHVATANELIAFSAINTTPTGAGTTMIAVKGIANGISSHYIIGAEFSSAGSSNTNIGVDAYSTNSSATSANYGGYFYAKGSANRNTGVYANAIDTIGHNVGGEFLAKDGTANLGVNVVAGKSGHPTVLTTANIGGKFEAINGVSFNYGVFASAPAGGCTATATTACSSAAGFFNGNVVATGIFQNSDSKLKVNVNDVTNGMTIINRLHPKTYKYNVEQYGFMGLGEELQYGLIAQEVQAAIPECVKQFGRPEEVDSSGTTIHPQVDFLTVNYTMLIPVLIAGMKEQQQQINDLQAQLNNLHGAQRTSAPSGGSNEKTGAIEVELNNVSKVIQLFQNDPNPFNEQTRIDFYIPDNIGKAEIWFVDNNGTVLKKVIITERGEGSMIVMGSNLTSGTYSYNLIADGKVIDGKKMIKVK